MESCQTPIVNCKKTQPDGVFSGNREYFNRENYPAKSITSTLFTDDRLTQIIFRMIRPEACKIKLQTSQSEVEK